MKSYKNNGDFFTKTNKSPLFKKTLILVNSIFLLSLSSSSDCMQNHTSSGEKSLTPTFERVTLFCDKANKEDVVTRALAAANNAALTRKEYAQNITNLLGLIEEKRNELTTATQVTETLMEHFTELEKLIGKKKGMIGTQRRIIDLLKEEKTGLQKKMIGQQKEGIKYLPYLFGAGIAGSIHPLLSRLFELDGQTDRKIRTIQENVQILQFLSFGVTVCGVEIDKYSNGPTAIDCSTTLGGMTSGIINVSLQAGNELILSNITCRLEKNDNYVVTTIRRLPEPIKQLGHSFIGWVLWYGEKKLFGIDNSRN